MPKKIDHTNKRYKHILILSHIDGNKWTGKCDCGTIKPFYMSNILSGKTKSCGCKRFSINLKSSRTWVLMRYRCNTPTSPDYPRYGGRGIKICKRWDNFENFYEDMGEPPDNHTLDRVDVNGDYSPENCQWATSKEQARNRRNTIYLTINGETCTAIEWAEKSGILYSTFLNRLKRGWSPEKAISIPTDTKCHTKAYRKKLATPISPAK